MELLNVQALQRAIRKHRVTEPWLKQWAAAVGQASWHSIKDVREQYPSADGVPLQSVVVTVFNVKGNEYRLLTIVRYTRQQVFILDVLTHAEYTKGQWKDRL